MNQKELISGFIDESKLKMNPELFVRSDEEVMEQLKNAILSCQRVNKYFAIKVKAFHVIEEYEKIMRILYEYYNNAYKNKTKAKRKDNRYEFINLNESDIRLLLVDYEISDKDETQDLQVIIAVPKIVDKYYFKIDGIMRSTLFQIVDGSTYNNSTSTSKNPSVTMKLIFMAVRIFRHYLDMPLIDGSIIRGTHYTAFCFNKSVSAVKYILAKMGFTKGMQYLGIDNIFITDTPITRGDYYCFKKSERLYVSCPRMLFDNDLITQTYVTTVFNAIYDGIPIYEYYYPSFWVRSLGADFNRISGDKFIDIFMNDDKTMVLDTLEKGASVLDSFETIYDICTASALKLPKKDKRSMYSVLRWMLREFNNLRMKDNLDISYKRIRFAEYVASLYVMKIARGIYRVADMNKRASIDTIIKAIKTDPLYLCKAIVMSKMISYRNMVSDMDSMQALKFTYKGISGLGEGGNRSIPDIYRAIQPSHIGRVDLDASSDTNPGITGTLNPFVQLDQNYFSNYEEPHSWAMSYAETLNEYKKTLNLIEVVEFQEKLLNIDKSDKKGELIEVANTMQQIINPIIMLNEEGLLEDDYNG